jgi:hypothetical protein
LMSRRVWSRKFGQHVASAFSAFGVFACVIPPFGKRGGPSADAQDGTEEFACAITIDVTRIQLRVAMRHGEAPTMPMMRTEMAKMTMARKGRFLDCTFSGGDED